MNKIDSSFVSLLGASVYSFKSTCFFYSDFSHNLVVVLIYTYNRSGSRVLNVQLIYLCGDIGRFTSGSSIFLGFVIVSGLSCNKGISVIELVNGGSRMNMR